MTVAFSIFFEIYVGRDFLTPRKGVADVWASVASFMPGAQVVTEAGVRVACNASSANQNFKSELRTRIIWLLTHHF